MKKIFVLILSNLILSTLSYSKDLNYIKLSALRGQHTFNSYIGGSTSIYLNSNQRFIDLYDSIQTEKTSEIEQEVDNAYNNPYKTELKLAQTIKYNDFLFELSIYNSLVAEVNNPVFPELDLFNVRSNIISVQKTFNFANLYVTSKLSLSNRWYMDELFTLEELVTDEVEVELEGGKTIVPMYLDVKAGLELNKNIIEASFRGLEITDNDQYSYFLLDFEYNRVVNKNLTIGLMASPIYQGNYLFKDSIAAILRLRISDHIAIESKVSELDSHIEGSLGWKHSEVNFGWDYIRQSSYSDLFISNLYLKLALRY